MDGYASTDGELDSDNDDGSEHELSRWLQQLDEPVKYNAVPHRTPTKSAKSTPTHQVSACNGVGNGLPTSTPAEIVDFDSILNDLSSLDHLFDVDTSSPTSSITNRQPVSRPALATTPGGPPRLPRSDNPLKEFESCDAVLKGALNELNTIAVPTDNGSLGRSKVVTTNGGSSHRAGFGGSYDKGINGGHNGVPILPGAGLVSNGSSSGLSTRRSSTTSSSTENSDHVIRRTDSCSSQETAGGPAATTKMSAKRPQAQIQVYCQDGSSNKVLADDQLTAARLCELLMKKRNVPLITKWILVEQIPDLYMERRIENHEFVLDVINKWNKDNNTNKLLFVENVQKYSVFAQDENQAISDPIVQLEGSLYLKSEGKKVWKKLDFSLQSTGLFCRKSKTDVICLQTLEDACIYLSCGWRKKYKSPTDYGLALKPMAVQKKAPKLIKYVCAEDEKTLSRWLNALRHAKYGSLLYTGSGQNGQSSRDSALIEVQTPLSAGPSPLSLDRGPSALTYEESTMTVQRRKGSLLPSLPISTQTTRLLAQQTVRPTVVASKDIGDDGTPSLFHPLSAASDRSAVPLPGPPDRTVLPSDRIALPRTASSERVAFPSDRTGVPLPAPPERAANPTDRIALPLPTPPVSFPSDRTGVPLPAPPVSFPSDRIGVPLPAPPERAANPTDRIALPLPTPPVSFPSDRIGVPLPAPPERAANPTDRIALPLPTPPVCFPSDRIGVPLPAPPERAANQTLMRPGHGERFASASEFPPPPTQSMIFDVTGPTTQNSSATNDFPPPPNMFRKSLVPEGIEKVSSPVAAVISSNAPVLERSVKTPPAVMAKKTVNGKPAISPVAYAESPCYKASDLSRSHSLSAAAAAATNRTMNEYTPQPTTSPARAKPAPPRRSETTKLTTGGFSADYPFQTRAFINNLDRVINLKKSKGSTGLASIPVPLPPRPVYAEGPTYLDMDDLPPPPAELLDGLRQMRTGFQTMGVTSGSPY